ncbi:MAG: tetratricopeptide repeat protein [Phycisphaerae bacterium]|nr:tetratricopeptide repeat protein [Phycisphaerae bacterium]
MESCIDKDRGFRPAAAGAPASQPRPARLWRFILLAVGAVLLVVASAFAQRADKPEPMEVMSKAWSVFYSAKDSDKQDSAKSGYEKVVRTLEPLANWPEAHVREEALHCAARAYQEAGTRQAKDRAKSIWVTMEKTFARRNAGFAPVGDSLGRRVLVGQAVMLAGEGKTAEAIKVLEPFRTVSSKYSDPCIAEGLLLLAELQVTPAPAGAGRPAAPIDPKQFEEAEKCLAQAESYLKLQVDPKQGGELNKTIVGPFEGAIKSARKRLADTKKESLTPGLPIFEKAEQMRGQHKYAEAVPLYREVIAKEPDAIYAHQSGYLIGVCALGLNRQVDAAKAWEKFIAEKPAAPWRGQAFVALSDMYLDELLDLTNAGKYADLARSALPTALADEKAAPSWKAITYDLELRLGLINLCLGKGDVAAEAFAAAKKLTTNKLTAEGLDALIAAAKTGKPVIPQDCLPPSPLAGEGRGEGPAAPTSKVALALSMGVIYTCSGRLDKADAYFERVLGKPGIPAKPGSSPSPSKGEGRGEGGIPAVPPMPGATKAQAAFAIFGQGAVLHARGKLDDAKDAFTASYKAFPDGRWVDETLYRLATIIQSQAEAKYPSPSGRGQGEGSAKPGTEGSAEAARPKSKDQLDKEAKAEKERIAARLLACGEATPYWEEILKRWLVKGDDGKLAPRSPRVEDALYNLGVLQYDLAEAGIDATGNPPPPNKLDAAWKPAAATLGRLCELYPKSMYAGDAYVRQVNVAMERMFDQEQAYAIAQHAVPWVRQQMEAKSQTEGESGSPAWAMLSHQPSRDSLNAVFFDCYNRAGLLAYLRQQKDQAVAFFREADHYDNSLRRRSGAETAMARMIAVVQGKVPALAPADFMGDLKDNKQKVGIFLADTALITFDPTRAAKLYTHLLAGTHPFPAPTDNVESYLLLRMGQAMEFGGKHDEAMVYLRRLYAPKYATYPWVADGIYRMAVWTYNHQQDPRAAAPHYRYVFTKYPDHPEAIRALFLYGLNAMNSGDMQEAISAFRLYLTRYPGTRWEQRIQTDLLPKALLASDKAKG